MIKVDIHSSKQRTERAKTTLQKNFSEGNAQTACKFVDRLRLDNKSYGRIANYADCIRRILEIKDDKNIQVELVENNSSKETATTSTSQHKSVNENNENDDLLEIIEEPQEIIDDANIDVTGVEEL